MIKYCEYTLTTWKGIKRSGALIRVTNEQGISGYADCHPWPELGDAPLEIQLTTLSTPLIRRALSNAKLDAEARVKGVNLLNGRKIPNSHYLLLTWDEGQIQTALDEKFQTIKLKCDLGFDFRQLNRWPTVKWRLDFNGKEVPKTLFNAVGCDAIEFIEDPGNWDEVRKWSGVALACDRNFRPDADVIIYKPALHERPKDLSVVVTSYLGHPLGQVADAYWATHINHQNRVAGLLSHRVYQPNPFSEYLSQTGPEFKTPTGTGFGFDNLLEKLEWRCLK